MSQSHSGGLWLILQSFTTITIITTLTFLFLISNHTDDDFVLIKLLIRDRSKEREVVE